MQVAMVIKLRETMEKVLITLVKADERIKNLQNEKGWFTISMFVVQVST